MRLWMYLVLIPVVLFNRGSETWSNEKITVRILFTNNSNGKLVNCNCRSDPFGGLAERVDLVRSYRRKFPDVLLLDSGGYFGLYGIERKGSLILELMDEMKYNAYGIGDQELYHGLEWFLELFGRYRGRIINASLHDTTGAAVFLSYKIATVNGIRIGITGLVSKKTFKYFPEENKDFSYETPDATLGRILPALKDSCDYIVVLSQMGMEMDRVVAERWNGINLIIGGHSQTLLEKAVTVSDCRIVQAGKNGGRVGEIVLTFDTSKTVTSFTYHLLDITKKYSIPEDIQLLLDKLIKTSDISHGLRRTQLCLRK